MVPALDKKALFRSIERDQRTAARAKVKTLAQQLREARKARTDAIRKAKARCREERLKARERAARLKEEAKEAARAAREGARSTCSLGLENARGIKERIESSRAELLEEKKHQADMRRIEGSNKKRRAQQPKTTARERESESDDEVRQNIPEDMIPLFNRIRKTIKGSARITRTEAFLQHVEENPEEYLSTIDDKTDALIRELEAQQRSGRRNPPKNRKQGSLFDADADPRQLSILDRPPPPAPPAAPPPPTKKKLTGKLAAIASGDLSIEDQRKLASQLRAALSRDYEKARRAGGGAGPDVEAAWAKHQAKFQIINEALETGAHALRASYARQIADLDRQIASKRAGPGTYRHELERMRNPSGALTELGKLTQIKWRGGKRSWPLSRAPSLAYDGAGRLWIVYALTAARGASAKEAREYVRTHWGQSGLGTVSDGLVATGDVRELGPGVDITYTTRKGSRELVDWIHEWGEGSRGRFVPPTVVEHVCRGSGCAARGTLALKGGTYRVTERGIVG